MDIHAKVCVVGSINMDLTVKTDTMPAQGETVLGNTFSTYPGGKGANQAVAAAKLGADVTMIGAVGLDAFGDTLLTHLQTENINVHGVSTVSSTSTGTATIILSDNDNRIIVAPGANNSVSPELVNEHSQLIKNSDIVLLQLEIPVETVRATLEIATKYHVPVILNPAPYQDLDRKLLTESSYLTPNEIEAEALMQQSDVQQIEEKLIITKGDQGVAFYENGEKSTYPGFSVDVKDTTGAGDTFNGALAALLGSGYSIKKAVEIANAAAALSVTKVGAQGGMPTWSEVETFIK